MFESKDLIVNKSFFQFLNKGYASCSLKDLEEGTGLTKGAFYYYFKNKAEILKAGIEKYLSVSDEIEEKIFSQIKSLKEYIHLVLTYKERKSQQLQNLFDFFIMEVTFFQLLLEVSDLFTEYRHYIHQLSKHRFERWKKMLLKAQQQGEIKANLEISVLAHNFMSVSTSMLNIELQNEDMHLVFSDMRKQFEQYYLLIKR